MFCKSKWQIHFRILLTDYNKNTSVKLTSDAMVYEKPNSSKIKVNMQSNDSMLHLMPLQNCYSTRDNDAKTTRLKKCGFHEHLNSLSLRFTLTKESSKTSYEYSVVGTLAGFPDKYFYRYRIIKLDLIKYAVIL